jgi:hypothetical protein
MKILLLAGFWLLLTQLGQAQSIVGHQVLPVNATSNTPVKLVLDVAYGNCSYSLNYGVARAGNTINISACYYSGPSPTVPCTRRDTVQLGLLPSGAYTGSIISSLASTVNNCTISTVFGPPTALSFTVGATLSAGRGAPLWQLSPTVVPPTASMLSLTGASQLQQIRIYDLAGREQARFETSTLLAHGNEVHLPLPALAPALYLLRIVDTNGQTSTKRFIRQ